MLGDLFRALRLLTAALGWVTVLLVVPNSCNPLVFAFLQKYTVRNATDERLLVSLISEPNEGENREQRRRLSPLAMSRLPAIPTFWKGRFPLSPGRALIVYHSNDDFYPSEIVVERPDGQVVQRPWKNIRTVIADLRGWEPATPEMRELIAVDWWRLPIRVVVGLWFAYAMFRPVVVWWRGYGKRREEAGDGCG